MLLYRLLTSLLSAYALQRAWREGGRAAARARLDPGPAPSGGHVWLHGASNGELASVHPLLCRLVRERPDLNWLVTANTASGLALAESWQLPRVTVRPAPVDLAPVARRICARWQVVAQITLEAELWPNRILSCPGPVLVLGARMSAGTARTWRRFPRLAARIAGRLAFVSAQDADSLRRLSSLGLPDSAIGPVVDLKAFYTPPAVTPDADLTSAFPRRRTWLAASTHPGEEEVVLQAHARLLRHAPDTLLILAPRHPRRGPEIARMARQAGLTIATRSAGEAPGNAQVYLADTMGEMALWYALAGRVFVAGSLTDRGGHTPYEPAAFRAALLHGPDTRNFAAAYGRLARAQAASRIEDAASLAEALNALQTPELQARMGDLAHDVLRPDADVQELCDRVLCHLPRP